MQLSITLAEILNYFLGSTTLVSIYLAWKSRKSTLKQAEATALDSIDGIYDKMSIRVDKELEKYQKIIDKQDKKIEDLGKKLKEYVEQCSACSNNKIDKK